MRIVVAHSRLHALGGGERITLELLRRLSRRHEVALWASDFDPAATYPELADFPRRDLHPWQWPVLRPQADAVIAQTYGARCLALRHPATLCYVHTLRSRYLRGSHRPDLAARRELDTQLLRRAGAVAAPSRFVASSLGPRIGRPVEIVAGGVDDDLFQLPAQVGSYALYVGRLAPEKGLERLLAWSTPADIDLVIAGTGTPAYTAHLRHLSGPRVHWAGALVGVDLHEVYHCCRCLVFTPEAEEFGLVVLEAMAAGKPVIVTPDGGLPELVHHGETGLLVTSAAEFTAAVAALAGDDALCMRMGAVGRAHARQYTWDALAHHVEAICERMVHAR